MADYSLGAMKKRLNQKFTAQQRWHWNKQKKRHDGALKAREAAKNNRR
jgi:hypothetical protein